jgi:hypothetical protein
LGPFWRWVVPSVRLSEVEKLAFIWKKMFSGEDLHV